MDNVHILPELLRATQDMGFTTFTEIQQKCIPLVQTGKDVLGQSHTGSGKTAAFGIPVIEMLTRGQGVQSLILVPTRELAEQVMTVLQKLAAFKPLEIISVYGGVGIDQQIRRLRTADLVVATPGRLLDHIQRKTIMLGKVKIAVLDEADKMFEMGFVDDVKKILSHLPVKRQTLLFSATIPREVEYLVQRFMTTPIRVKTSEFVESAKMVQQYFMVDSSDKFSLLLHLLREMKPALTLIFCSTRKRVDAVAKNLKVQGFEAHGLHGGLSQNQRKHALDKFHNRESEILVASDVAARGLDIREVSLVLNYDAPRNPKDYVHRMGRTARAGKSGIVVSLVSGEDHNDFGAVRQEMREDLISMELPEFKRIPFVKLGRDESKESSFPRHIHRDRFRKKFDRGPKRR
ncbi:MAG: DEAD/DEAH box helicase [Nanoarchaeota archaeon]|nr:DEAD/DEAH box helicase [Nanoarchaeota archaeon]